MKSENEMFRGPGGRDKYAEFKLRKYENNQLIN